MNLSGARTNPLQIAVTMGDPAGIGPEICLHLLADARVREFCVPVIFGDVGVLERVASATGLKPPLHVVSVDQWPVADLSSQSPAVLDLNAIDASAVKPGVVNAATGRAAYAYIEKSIDAALAGEVAAVVTGPIHKEGLRAAGVPYPGHTEIYAAKTGTKRACMMLTSSELTCSFVTAHVGYRDVPALLSVERILDVIELTADAMRRLRSSPPRLVVCGLNPHAGEHGLFGDREEEQFITPAIEAARSKGIAVEGPLPPDTAFLPGRRKSTDAFICMYHDQGHIPLKALAFDEAVNITLGLPIIRTSVDHGTALDIAWQGKANPNSLFEAVKIAAKLAAGGLGVIAVIADDFTGAAELASAAVDLGLSAEVQTRFDPTSDAMVIAVNTDTRATDELPAAKIVSDVARDIKRANPYWIYKKTDSVLRGNVRAEIEALMDATGMRRCLLVPANPSKGRTIRGGVYCINGKCLEETTFANDPQHPRRSSKILDLLGHSTTQVGLVELAPADGIVVPDVESDGDLFLRASECNSSTLAAGGVEFFIALLRSKTMKQITIRSQPRPLLKAQRSLLVCGSAQAWSHGRAEECRRRDVPVHAMPEKMFSASSDAPDGAIHQWAEMISKSLEAKGAAMAAIGRDHIPSLASTHRLTELLVGAVIDVLNKNRCDHLYVEGGSTAAALARQMGWTQFRAVPAPLTGVACLQPVGRESPLLFVKPGSYPWPQEIWPANSTSTQSAG